MVRCCGPLQVPSPGAVRCCGPLRVPSPGAVRCCGPLQVPSPGPDWCSTSGGGRGHPLSPGRFRVGGGGAGGVVRQPTPPPTGRSRPPRWGPGGGLPGQHAPLGQRGSGATGHTWGEGERGDGERGVGGGCPHRRPTLATGRPTPAPVGVPAESRGPCGARGRIRGGCPRSSYGGGPGDAGPVAASDTNLLARTVAAHGPGLPMDETRSSSCCTRCPFPCRQACAPHTTGWPLVSAPLSGPAWLPPLGLKPPREEQALLIRPQTVSTRVTVPNVAPGFHLPNALSEGCRAPLGGHVFCVRTFWPRPRGRCPMSHLWSTCLTPSRKG